MFEDTIRYFHISSPEFYTYFVVYHTIAVLIFVAGIVSRLMIFLSGTERVSDLVRSFLNALKEDSFTLIRIFITEAVFQKRLLNISKLRWFAHFCIFISMIALTVLTTLGFYVLHLRPMDLFISGWGRKWIIDFANELFGFLLITGLIIALLRRPAMRNTGRNTEWEDIFAVIFLFIVALTGFMLEGIRFDIFDPYSFLGSIFGRVMFHRFDYNTFWVVHTILSSAFIAYIPYSRLIHIFTTPLITAWTTYREIKEYGGVR